MALFTRLRSLPQEEVGGYEEREDHGNNPIRGEECSIEFGEIIRLYKRMFVNQEEHHGDDAGSREFAESESWKQGDEKHQHNEMEGARDPKSGADTDVARDGVQSGVAIELEILAGVENIEAGNPERNGRGEQQNTRIEGSADSNPGGGRSHPESEAED